MLDTETKRKIDNARDILVGKVPDPKSQVDQITIALIYKFMDDIDQEAEELGGKIKFFTGEFEKYAWSKIMDSKLGGRKRLDLYAEGLTQMSRNKNLPQLFRDIFKDAFLPYRDPETLNLFLKEINGFTYDHSERLGDAFEYLLLVMGSQGKAGQFRTPRHIIEFIIDVVDPDKNDTILDPACGTAGFLISAYKHILEKHTKKERGDKLTPDQRGRLTRNFVGYDISPDMVRLSLVNMYLHKFPSPLIYEYDTLTSEERWQDKFNVIMANPPFMTPKGGIRPHRRFAIQANRSELLFVDYIAEHLTPNGRAGIIVPEGIIFQSSNAYKNLRRMLIEDGYLWAVVSLPAGVFNPYSGVKTSILFLDKVLAKRTKNILFVKIENDGFDLGAQRRAIEGNDLMIALRTIKAFQKNPTIKNKHDLYEKITGGQPAIVGASVVGGDNRVWPKDIIELVVKEKIAASGNYNLSGERYKEITPTGLQKWPMVGLGEILDYEQPTNYIVSSEDYNDKYEIPVLTAGKSFILGHTNEKTGIFKDNLPVIIFDDFTTATKLVDFPFKVKSSAMKILKAKKELADVRFVYYMMQKINFDASRHKRYWISQYSKIKIPLPSLRVQKQIVEELENLQKEVEFNNKETESLRVLQKRIIENVWCEDIKKKDGIPFIDKCEIESQLVDLENLLILSRNNYGKTVFIYFLEHCILGLRELSYLMAKYFQEELNFNIKEKIRRITKTRNAICHRSSPLNFVNVKRQIKFVRNIIFGKGNLAKINNVELKSDFDNDIAIFYGNIRIYMFRDVKFLIDQFKKIYLSYKSKNKSSPGLKLNKNSSTPTKN